ncbi:MAG: YeeE/YedE family protein [Notoacmeibacter sp.]
METEFTPFASLLGGIMIGLAATLLMAFHGRIMGMTGILSGVLPPFASDWLWRAAFLAGASFAPVGLILGGYQIPFFSPAATQPLVIGGLIVGFGVKLGSGCTSGHGICGIARLSPRSIVATCVFMVSTAATVYAIRHIVWS